MEQQIFQNLLHHLSVIIDRQTNILEQSQRIINMMSSIIRYLECSQSRQTINVWTLRSNQENIERFQRQDAGVSYNIQLPQQMTPFFSFVSSDSTVCFHTFRALF